MATTNGYVTLPEFKGYITSPGAELSSDSTDDGVIEALIEAASRYVELETRRKFYPTVETRLYDVPDREDTYEPRLLMLDGDLLAVTTLTNGDATVITSSDYRLLPYNATPYYAIRLKDTSDVIWECDTDSSAEAALSVAGTWGYRSQYAQRGWKAAGTLAAAINDTTGTSATMTAGHSLESGQLIKIDSELCNVTVATNTLTLVRGDNGSTAATHLIGSTVYAWQPEEAVKQAVFEIANNAYHRRWGENKSGQSFVSPAGVVVGPADLTAFARQVIQTYRRAI